MAAGLTILITGASRGIGKALVTAYLSQPNNTVIAAVRNPADPGPQSLPSLPTGPNTTLIVVPLEATSPPSIAAALRTLDHDHGVRHLDVVVANAGAAFGLGGKLAVLDPATAIQQNIDVNAYGPLWLFQHSLPLLRGAKEPVFVAVSSAAASRALLQFTGGIPMGGYAVAKALLNTIVARLAVEEEDVVTLALDPGHVATDGGRETSEVLGLEGLERIPVEESVAGIVKVIAEATKEKSGHFIKYTGEEVPW